MPSTRTALAAGLGLTLALVASAHFDDTHSDGGSAGPPDSQPGDSAPAPGGGGGGGGGDAPAAPAPAPEAPAGGGDDGGGAGAAAPAEGGGDDGSNAAAVAGGAAVGAGAIGAGAAIAVAGGDDAAAGTDEEDSAADTKADGSDEPEATLAPGETPDPDETPEVTPDTSVEASDDDDGSVCFPAGATVEMEDGGVKRMDEVSVGDVVKVGAGEFSRVFMFTHKMAGVENKFVRIEAAGSVVELTAGHYIYANGVLVAAGEVQVGDSLRLGDGGVGTVEKVGLVKGHGLYNPQTVQGDVVVDGVQASTYTTAVEPTFAHAVLAPMRKAFEVLGMSTAVLENGSDVGARAMPAGGKVCL